MSATAGMLMYVEFKNRIGCAGILHYNFISFFSLLRARLFANLLELFAAHGHELVIIKCVLVKAVYGGAHSSGANLTNVNEREANHAAGDAGNHAGDESHSLGRLDKAEAQEARLHDAARLSGSV